MQHTRFVLLEMMDKSYVDDKGTQLVLLQCDDFMIARLLCQLQQGAGGCQSQPGHVGFTEGQEAENKFMHRKSKFNTTGHNNDPVKS